MPSARDHAADLLLEWDKTRAFVREPLAQRRAALSDPRERGLLTELVYGPIRQLGTLDKILERFASRPLRALNAGVRTAVRLGLYQVLYLDRVPAHAAVDHAVGWARGRSGPKRAGFVNGVLRGTLRAVEGKATGEEQLRRDVPRPDGTCVRFKRDVFADPAKDEAANLAQRWSMPRWLVERWVQTFGTLPAIDLLRTGIQRPALGVRARDDAAALLARLAAAGADVRAGPVDGSLVVPSGEAHVLAEVEAGHAAIQDPTSQRVAPLCAAGPGARVLDLCAAPGGKTLHLADLMQSGSVVAADVDAAKVEALKDLAPRMGAVTLETHHLAPAGALPFESGTFDAVLVDAPCTNTGVLRRRVEARWRLTAKDIGALATIQRGLLEAALPLLVPGGRLVYSTCSLEPEENEVVTRAMAAAHPELAMQEAYRVVPGADHDGGFAVVFTVPTSA
ncbi:MAG: transcription antitermination factor NusB [Planctomycetota bacterium]|nr:transcription antitermination factor NusB [Planctomycetota bacterium]